MLTITCTPTAKNAHLVALHFAALDVAHYEDRNSKALREELLVSGEPTIQVPFKNFPFFPIIVLCLMNDLFCFSKECRNRRQGDSQGRNGSS